MASIFSHKIPVICYEGIYIDEAYVRIIRISIRPYRAYDFVYPVTRRRLFIGF